VLLPSGKILRARAIGVGAAGRDGSGAGLPRLPRKKGRITPEDAAKMIGDTIGDYHKARIGTGWVMASIRSHEVFKRLKFFPYLFVSGQKASGKTTFCRWLTEMGCQERTADNASETTQTAVSRNFAYYSSIPYWLDDWRRSSKCERKTDLLLSLYNRESASKGIKGPHGLRFVIARGALLLSGEHLPSDSALLSRCVVLRFAPGAKPNVFYNELQKAGELLAGVSTAVMKAKRKDVDRWLDMIPKFAAHLESLGVDARSAANWSIPVTAWDVFGVADQDDIADWVREQSHITMEERNEERCAVEFWSEIGELRFRGILNGTVHRRLNDGNLAIATRACWSAYAESLRRKGYDPVPYREIQKSLREESFFVEDSKLERIEGKPVRCTVLNGKLLPADIKAMFGDVEPSPPTLGFGD
jgi:hypothetical protein